MLTSVTLNHLFTFAFSEEEVNGITRYVKIFEAHHRIHEKLITSPVVDCAELWVHCFFQQQQQQQNQSRDNP